SVGEHVESVPRDAELREVWLSAWEETYRDELVNSIEETNDQETEKGTETGNESDTDDRPFAQLVFCIDTRSEVIRRHIEAVGETGKEGDAG
ncbi:MAG: putative inorganic carbon transporter subunit DabA, partial [Halobacteria archaeon]|nr:putative inorganic carbon transporter subunit DabA [Halobacteria archaeon]